MHAFLDHGGVGGGGDGGEVGGIKGEGRRRRTARSGGKVEKKSSAREEKQTRNDIHASYNCCLSPMIYVGWGGINNRAP